VAFSLLSKPSEQKPGRGKMTAQSVEERIQAELDLIEKEEVVRVLYACESGSRAWGFESEDSDFDVRFIYIRPPEWYLTIQKKRDVIERPIDDDLDVSGWDLPKALELFRKSNPPLLEWLQSPLVYREVGSAANRLREVMPSYYAPISCMYHYLHMAQGNYRQYLHGDTVRLKKYFYALRPVLGCLWIERDMGVVPTEFGILVDRLVTDDKLREAIERLLEKKKAGHELDQGKRIPEISEFLDRELSRLSAENQEQPRTKDPKLLDALFIELLIENHGDRLGTSIQADLNKPRC
jgi:uncharacterized protein